MPFKQLENSPNNKRQEKCWVASLFLLKINILGYIYDMNSLLATLSVCLRSAFYQINGLRLQARLDGVKETSQDALLGE